MITSDDTPNWRPEPCIDDKPHQFEPRYDFDSPSPPDDPDTDWRPSYGANSKAGGIYQRGGRPKVGYRYLFDICIKCGRKIHNITRRS